MFLNNTNQLLSNGGEAFFVAVYDSPYLHIYKDISKNEKWSKYMHDVKNIYPAYFYWPNITKTYTQMANEARLQVVSCQLEIKNHVYIPYVFWKSVNPYLPRITEAKEKEEFIQELHEKTMCSDYILPKYPESWTKLLIVHLKKSAFWTF